MSSHPADTTAVPEAVLHAVTTLQPHALADLTLPQALDLLWDGWTLLLADHTTRHPDGFIAVLREDPTTPSTPGTSPRRWCAIRIPDTETIWSKRDLRYRWVMLDHTHHRPPGSVIAPTLPDLLAQFQPLINRVDSPWVLAAINLLDRTDPDLAEDIAAANMLLGLDPHSALRFQMDMYTDLCANADLADAPPSLDSFSAPTIWHAPTR